MISSNILLPIDREIQINQSVKFYVKLSQNKTIEYINHSFCEVSGYEEFDFIGETISDFGHPDMPKSIFDLILTRIANKQSVKSIIKFIAKDGRCFWILAFFIPKLDVNGALISYYLQGTSVSQYSRFKIKNLYLILRKIEEKTGNTKASLRYLIGYLEDRNISYDQLIEDISTTQTQEASQQIQPTKEMGLDNLTLKQENNLNTQQTGFLRSNALLKQPKKKISLFKRIFG